MANILSSHVRVVKAFPLSWTEGNSSPSWHTEALSEGAFQYPRKSKQEFDPQPQENSASSIERWGWGISGAHWVKPFLCKQEDISLNPQHPLKWRSDMEGVTVTLERRRQGVPEAGLSASLLGSVRDPVLKSKTENDKDRYCLWPCTHTHS